MSSLFFIVLLLLAAEVVREALHVDKEVMADRPDKLVSGDMTAGGAGSPPTALELRLMAKSAAPPPERIYVERWSTCRHDFRPLGVLGVVCLEECRDCGWAKGCAG